MKVEMALVCQTLCYHSKAKSTTFPMNLSAVMFVTDFLFVHTERMNRYRARAIITLKSYCHTPSRSLGPYAVSAEGPTWAIELVCCIHRTPLS